MTRVDVRQRTGVLRSLIVHPGFVFVASLAAAGVLDRAVPLRIATRMETRPVQGLVAALVAGAIILFAWCFRTFRRHATSPEPGSTPAALITDGPFARSRNPVYVALLAVSLALAIVGSSLWFLGATLTLAAILDRVVIPREEAVMRAAFGAAYEVYRGRVRRWV